MKIKELYLSLVKEGKKSDVLEIDIRFLISFYNDIKDSSNFYLLLDKEVKNLDLIKEGFNKLKKGIPLGYIIKQSYFLSNIYKVSEDTLIPRVETEELVMLMVFYLEKIKNKNIRLLDIGTGSGVIAIELKKRYPNIIIDAIDISSKALDIAKENAKKYNCDINFYLGDTFPNNDIKYDVIISNPPYLKYKKDVDKSVLDNEPNNALFISEENNVYKKVFSNLNRVNNPCFILFEISPDLEDELTELINKNLSQFNLSYIFSKDINKKTRFLSILLAN